MIFVIGVDAAKDAICGRLRITKPGPGYIHFRIGDAFDQKYFEQLTSEQVLTRKREGCPFRIWVLPAGVAKPRIAWSGLACPRLCGSKVSWHRSRSHHLHRQLERELQYTRWRLRGGRSSASLLVGFSICRAYPAARWLNNSSSGAKLGSVPR